VQCVIAPTPNFRGHGAGWLEGGSWSTGLPVSKFLHPDSGPTISRIVRRTANLAMAIAVQAVTLTLMDEVDGCAGDTLIAEVGRPSAGHAAIAARLVWTGHDVLSRVVLSVKLAAIDGLTPRLSVHFSSSISLIVRYAPAGRHPHPTKFASITCERTGPLALDRMFTQGHRQFI